MNDDHVQALVARYHAEGLGGMNSAEVRALLDEKVRHLDEVGARLQQGREPLVNLKLKEDLEGQIGEIAKHHGLFKEWAEDYAAAKERDYQKLLDGASSATARDGREMER